MAITINNKTYRNLQEQVAYNAQKIEEFDEARTHTYVLNLLGSSVDTTEQETVVWNLTIYNTVSIDTTYDSWHEWIAEAISLGQFTLNSFGVYSQSNVVAMYSFSYTAGETSGTIDVTAHLVVDGSTVTYTINYADYDMDNLFEI